MLILRRLTVLVVLVILASTSVVAQYHIIGFVYDAQEQPYAGNEVRLVGEDSKQVAYTDPEGRFEFHDIARGEYHVIVITEYGLIDRSVNVRTSLEMHLQRPRNVPLDEVVVSAVRGDEQTPIGKTTIKPEDIRGLQLGPDMPYLLDWTPSTVVTSDGGNGIGYTGMRVRGTDPTRINVTVNGVPLNDAESQSVYWVDLPDFSESTESIQIQRGVGSSTFGTGAFGASVHLNTTKTTVDPYASISGSFGSFNSYKLSGRFGTGLIANHYTFDGRLSTIQTDGFIDRASADLKSYFASAAYIGAKTSLRFTTFSGYEKTYQAWYGVPAQYIDDPVLRTYNVAGTEKPGEPYDNEVDDYTQSHYQLHLNQAIFTQLQSYVTLFYTRGKGYFEQYKAPMYFDEDFTDFLKQYDLDMSDVIRRRWLDNHFFGGIAGVQFTDPSEKFDVKISGGFNKYKGRHYGEVIKSVTYGETPGLPPYYDNDAVKTSGNFFIKVNYNLTESLRLLVDLQYRSVNYTFEGFDDSGVMVDQNVRHKFFMPKLGLTKDLNEHWQTFIYSGIARREPNREDYVSSSPASRPSPETLWDTEAGVKFKASNIDISARGYYMFYKDQLVLTGRLNDVGDYTRVNVDNSYRLGLETEINAMVLPKLQLGAFVTASANKVREFDEYIDNWDYDPAGTEPEQYMVHHENTQLAFSPGIIAGAMVGYSPVKTEKHSLLLSLMAKYVGPQYVDNTGRDVSRIEGYAYADFKLSYTFQWTEERSVEFHALIRNLFDAQYESNAWNYRFQVESFDPVADDPYVESEGGNLYHQRGYFPQAGINYLMGLTLTF